MKKSKGRRRPDAGAVRRIVAQISRDGFWRKSSPASRSGPTLANNPAAALYPKECARLRPDAAIAAPSASTEAVRLIRCGFGQSGVRRPNSSKPQYHLDALIAMCFRDSWNPMDNRKSTHCSEARGCARCSRLASSKGRMPPTSAASWGSAPIRDGKLLLILWPIDEVGWKRRGLGNEAKPTMGLE